MHRKFEVDVRSGLARFSLGTALPPKIARLVFHSFTLVGSILVSGLRLCVLNRRGGLLPGRRWFVCVPTWMGVFIVTWWVRSTKAFRSDSAIGWTLK